MKKMFFMLMLMVAIVPASIAQDKSADEYKNEGNAAVREKNYQVALEAYKQAITLWGDSADAMTVYNAADCARRLEEYDTALKFYAQSIELKYKPDYATYYIAEIYGKQDKTEERIALLEEASQTYTEGKVASFIKKGLAKEYTNKANALYKEGASILQETQKAKPEQYKEIEERAAAKFAEVKPWLDKIFTIDPENANAKNLMNGIKDYIK